MELMSAAALISVEEYLHTSFEDGDREYVDGRIVERNVGEVDHSDLQTAIASYLRVHWEGVWAGVEVRVQVKPTRFRVPDICIASGGKPAGRIITAPPLAVIEILSREDRAEDIQEKINDYLEFGIRYVWVVNPRTRVAYVYTSFGIHAAKDGVLRTEDPALELPLAEMF
jgi:Uma2 family endonuclease